MNPAETILEIEKIEERLLNLRISIEQTIHEQFMQEKRLQEMNHVTHTIDYLPLSISTTNLLNHNGIYTLDELKYWKQSDIKKLKMDNITLKKTSIKHLRLILKCFGLSFKKEDEDE